MKKILVFSIVMVAGLFAYTQVGIGSYPPHPSARLDLDSTEKGFLPPRLNTPQRDAITEPAVGLTIFNTNTNCIQWWNGKQWWDACSWNCGQLFTDSRDGNSYATVLIGDQCWMAQSLKHLPEVHANMQFITKGNNSEPGYGVYGYDGSDVETAKSEPNYQNYGVLYNWFAVNQASVCPAGWHVATDVEWLTLRDFVEDQGYPNESENPNGAANALKSCRQVGSPLGFGCSTSDHPRWDSNITHFGTDVFGFSALPGGYRTTDGSFHFLGTWDFWWSSTESNPTQSWAYGVTNSVGVVSQWGEPKVYGFSVRCLKD